MTRPEIVPTHGEAADARRADSAFPPRRTWTERPSLKGTLGPVGNLRLAVALLGLGDVLACAASLTVVAFLPFVAFSGSLLAFPAVFVCMVLGLYVAGAYGPDGFDNAKSLTMSLSVGLVLSALFVTVAEFVWPSSLVGRQAIAVFFLVVSFLLTGWRFAGVHLVRRRFAPEAVAIVGNGRGAYRLAEVLASTPSFRLAMTVNPLSAKAVQVVENGGPPRGTPVADIPSVMSGAAIKLIAVADSIPTSQAALVRQLRKCRSTGVDVQDVANCIELLSQKVPVRLLQKWRKPSLSFPGWERKFDDKLKRFSDILFSAIAMILTAPAMLATGLAVRWSDGGPAFYKQARVGTHGRIYTLYKFRSMEVDAERNGAVWASEDDPRVTKVGRFMRKLHLDELPQLWNVFRGDMSLVGPRPERPEFVDWLRLSIPHYDARHTIKPGITGWAQIRYPYGASAAAAEDKLEYDLYYVRHRNVLWDLYILFRTIVFVSTGRRT